MFVKSLVLRNFRCYDDLTMDFAEGVNVIWGNNAQGKTNLLEALFLLSSGRSFRTPSKKELIKFGCDFAGITANSFSRERDFFTEAVIPQNSTAFFKVNGVKCKRNSQLAEVLKCVVFRPEDLNLIKGGASERRRLLDNALCQLRPSYAEALSRYNRILDSRQRILRDAQPSLYKALDSFSEGLAAWGAVIIKKRAEFCRLLAPKAGRLHREMSDAAETLSLEYRTFSECTDSLAETESIRRELLNVMITQTEREIAAKQCLFGPHRDDVSVNINGADARSFGSQGQARTAALAVKLAERQLFFEDSGEYPLLLLDDVLSELDPARQDFVLNHISGGQVFITCCEPAKLAAITGGATFHIDKGRVLL